MTEEEEGVLVAGLMVAAVVTAVAVVAEGTVVAVAVAATGTDLGVQEDSRAAMQADI